MIGAFFMPGSVTREIVNKHISLVELRLHYRKNAHPK